MNPACSRDEAYGYNGRIKESLEDLKLPITTADHFPDREYRVLGPVLGILSSYNASSFEGNKWPKDHDFDGKLEVLRIQAISRMISMTHMLRGDAVIGMRFDSFGSGSSYGNQCVYGIAVKFLEETVQPPRADILADSRFDDSSSRVSEWTNLSSTTAGP